jgi:endonuclease YncB( thermonuclease family)
MKRLVAFWQKDIINKLIVLVSITLIVGAVAILWLALNPPDEISLADILPARATPTLGISPNSTREVALPSTKIPTITAEVFPTFSIPPSTPTFSLVAPIILFPTPTIESVTATVTQSQSTVIGFACIPNNPPLSGKVLEVLDGNTIRVLMKDDGLVYVIRYIGVALPENKQYSALAKQKNSNLVYGREVMMIQDAVPKDDRGRLMSYVIAGDSFVNLELIGLGFATTLNLPSNSSCAQSFTQAEEHAREAQSGVWKPIP